jgi:hypothetical protein
MTSYRWMTSGSLEQIEESLSSSHFPKNIFPIVSQGADWYQIGDDIWLIVEVNQNDWQLYYWQKCDPRPFIRTISVLKGFK